MIKQNFTLIQDRSHNTLSGFPVVNRWKRWVDFRNLGIPEMTNETEMVKIWLLSWRYRSGHPTRGTNSHFYAFYAGWQFYFTNIWRNWDRIEHQQAAGRPYGWRNWLCERVWNRQYFFVHYSFILQKEYKIPIQSH